MTTDLLFTTRRDDPGSLRGGADREMEVGAKVCGRFRIEGVLGRGATGDVLSVHEASLERNVAMKVLRGASGSSIARLMREARLTARLDHPNVPPVHFLEFLPDGGVLFTMRQLDGKSLGDAIRLRHGNGEPSPIDTVNSIINVIQRVCDALSRAHALGIVHRDVKPDNIMLGAHGEVALVDWGECRLLGEPDTGNMVGTPAYMSPEQARGQPAHQRSDVYALGATLYHVLTGLLPVWHADPAKFWEMKRAGTLEEPAAEVARRLPSQLLAICRRAMAADPEERYESASGFSADLERFQAGLAVAAHPDTLFSYLLRWYRRHRLPVLSATTALVVSSISGWLLWESHLRTIADWGRPVHEERFDNDGWQKGWVFHAGQAEIQDGRLVTTSNGPFLLMYQERLSGAGAIEFDGEMIPGCQPSDLSAFWCSGREDVARQPWEYFKGLNDLVLLQTGAYANTCAMIYNPSVRAAVALSTFKLEHGRRYRIRAEVDGCRLSLYVDGRKLCETNAPMPHGSGFMGVYGFFNGKSFDNLRIWRKGLAEAQPATAVGDALYRAGRPAEAVAAYAEVERSLEGRPIAIEARYRRSLALLQAGDPASAYKTWQSLTGSVFSVPAELNLADADASTGNHEAALERLDRLAATGNDDERRQCAVHWAMHVGALLRLQPRPDSVIDHYIAMRDRRLMDASFLQFVMADVLASRGRFKELLSLCPDIDYQCAHALVALGRFEEAIDRYPHISWQAGNALLQLGRAEEVLKRYPADDRLVAEALLQLGRLEEASKRALLTADGLPELQLACGRFDLVLESPMAKPAHRIAALRALGRLADGPHFMRDDRIGGAQALLELCRYEEVISQYPDDRAAMAEALLQLGRQEGTNQGLGSNVHLARAAYHADPTSYVPPSWNHQDYHQLYIDVAVGRGPTVEMLALETADLDLQAYIRLRLGRYQEVLQRYRRQRWACSQALLLLNKPAEVLHQYPDQWRSGIEARMMLSLHKAAEGRLQEAAGEAAGIDSIREPSFGMVVIPPLLRCFAGEAGNLSDELSLVLKIRHRGDYGAVWYDTALLAGHIQTEEYLAQPFKPGVRDRWQLCQAIRSDLSGNHAMALVGYRTWGAAAVRQPRLDPVLNAYVAWRIRVLAETSND